ncbi:MAG: hypothetical protein GY754_37320 [bacterium]|nr:hypothetical protein [bacterium]
MRLRTVLLICMLLVMPFPVALLMGNFIDYTDSSNRAWLYYHPGYYHYHWSTGGRMSSGSNWEFRGGGPAFGK